nr:cellulase family glycosylhydrolase [Kibdelosporangium sp. MJ126-NF4]CEL18126.1 hypothetical protein [Kibdelosporangium sp. MJ126-NF4]
MTRRLITRTTAGLAVVLLTASVTTVQVAASPAAGPVIDVQGNHLTLDGRPWRPRGINLVGLLAPNPDTAGDRYKYAAKHFSKEELDTVRTRFGADSIRFQVSVGGLDPQSTVYDPAYLQRLTEGVNLALSKDFKVLLSMQHQEGSQTPGVNQWPSEVAVRAWKKLAPVFKNNRSVMYELYNEPGGPWDLWRNGGTVPQEHGGGTSVGHQRLVDTVRATGAQNLLIAEGAYVGKNLEGLPEYALNDPLNRLAYGIHAYHGDRPALSTADGIERAWGPAAAQYAVVNTEWSSGGTKSHCLPNEPEVSDILFDFFDRYQIGSFGWAADVPGSITMPEASNTGQWIYKPNTFTNFRCDSDGTGDLTKGSGQFIIDRFKQQAATTTR